MLTVGETLTFAARTRTPRNRPEGVTREQWADHMRDVVMAVFGLSHTVNTQVGNDFIRGVSSLHCADDEPALNATLRSRVESVSVYL
jgi:ABC-type multidrug transport system ATPase subunit